MGLLDAIVLQAVKVDPVESVLAGLGLEFGLGLGLGIQLGSGANYISSLGSGANYICSQMFGLGWAGWPDGG
ncbi:unnamed protein product [Anisakis simplex]|uniref:ABC transporter permease n=1 Tax=Anisakis simplex TaxID=6269 RepID=A0A0M3J265_ANISI|nr:unnamed protein product [Anisakis simplex]